MLSVTGSTPAPELKAWGDPSFGDLIRRLAIVMPAPTAMLRGDYWQAALFVSAGAALELNRRLGTRPTSTSLWLRVGCLALIALGFVAVYVGSSASIRATGLALAFAPALMSIRTSRDHAVSAS
jgi:hypothetical protein